ncbi:zwei Ig domain protein zig-8-like [Amphibalanus amphitrite]|uniref:zwei Ig domain protein zig-8-like n=1 Tax=Amphibalanus amphitrite TaxID=1232801 RepID=UPI001C90D54D|nr:zwei Ig domain protein zig-8-like [Amphibalanus amphitrite]
MMFPVVFFTLMIGCSDGNRLRHWAHSGSLFDGPSEHAHSHTQRSTSANGTETNTTAQLGTPAFLHCRQPASAQTADGRPTEVSWLRRRDWHLLTTGKTVFTSDERFQIYHVKADNDWVLKISFAQLRDEGLYECQIPTDKGKLSYFTRLRVVQPVATIEGTGLYHVERGTSISLSCVIREALTPPTFVHWHHNDKVLNPYNLRSDIQVSVEHEPRQTRSTLNITDVRDTDSGNYNCSADNTRPASVRVYVSEGDKMAAIQRRNGGSAASWLGGTVTLAVMLALLVQTVR